MSMTGPVPVQQMQQSLQRLRIACGELEGVTNQLVNGSSDQRRTGLRLQDVLSVYQEELNKIGYMVEQGAVAPMTSDQVAIGLRVQEALNEISQI